MLDSGDGGVVKKKLLKKTMEMIKGRYFVHAAFQLCKSFK